MAQLKLTNANDLENVRLGLMRAEQVRSLEVEALVDTGATMLILPADVVERLGVPIRGQRSVRYADGRTERVPWVGLVELEVLGRAMVADALVQPEGTKALLGQIPLEELDLIVDPKSRDVRVNPESPDIPLVDALAS